VGAVKASVKPGGLSPFTFVTAGAVAYPQPTGRRKKAPATEQAKLKAQGKRDEPKLKPKPKPKPKPKASPPMPRPPSFLESPMAAGLSREQKARKGRCI